eukprot:561911-Rhodomonas_salina.6
MSQTAHAGGNDTKRVGRFIKPLKNIENATEEEKQLTAIINKKQSEEEGISIPQTHLRMIIDKILQDVAADESHSKTAEGDNIAYNIRALAFATIHRATEEYLTDLLKNALDHNTGNGEILAPGSVQHAATLMLENKKMKLRYGEEFADVSIEADLESENSNNEDAESDENMKKTKAVNHVNKNVVHDATSATPKAEKKKEAKGKEKRKIEEKSEGVGDDAHPKKKTKKNESKKNDGMTDVGEKGKDEKETEKDAEEKGSDTVEENDKKKKKKNTPKQSAVKNDEKKQVKETKEKKVDESAGKKKKKNKKGEVDLENVVLDEIDE